MGVVKKVVDYFRSAPNTKEMDRYGIMAPIIATEERLSSTIKLLETLQDSESLIQATGGRGNSGNPHIVKGVEAYKDYVRGLPGLEQGLERRKPFSTIIAGLSSINGNLHQIEDNFTILFGQVHKEDGVDHVRTSSLMVAGYLEKTDTFLTWIALLAEHVSADASDLIPPFQTQELLAQAHAAAEFVSFNLHKWNSTSEGFLQEVRTLQKKGMDLAVKSGDTYLDSVVHDDQFSPDEQDLITASLRSPIMMAITWGHTRTQEKLDLLSSRKEWLTSKIILEEGKLNGMDPQSPEYKKLKMACDHYANLTSKLERKIERMRG